MKKSLSILIGLFFMTVPILAQETVDNAETVAEPVAHINYIEGEAFFRNFEKVELNVIVQEGDEINATANGRVEISLKGGGVIRLDYNTIVTFASLAEAFILLEVRSGNIYVEKGELEVGIKSANKSLNLSQSEWYLKKPEKNFKKWNNVRNKETALHDDEYLPEELDRFGGTLRHHGYWRHDPYYGYVWIPYAHGWRPYHNGRWSWYGSRRMWISYDPFGWCVHHYGRWHWGSGLGWYWIPTRTWGPAWVLWSILSDCIGWSPLWYGGYNSHYYRNYYHDYYGCSYSRAWTFIPGNRLGSRGSVDSYVISKSQLKKRAPGKISSSNLETSLSTVSTRSTKSASKSALRSTGRISPKNNILSPEHEARKRLSRITVRKTEAVDLNRVGKKTVAKVYPSRERKVVKKKSEKVGRTGVERPIYKPKSSVKKDSYNYPSSRKVSANKPSSFIGRIYKNISGSSKSVKSRSSRSSLRNFPRGTSSKKVSSSSSKSRSSSSSRSVSNRSASKSGKVKKKK